MLVREAEHRRSARPVGRTNVVGTRDASKRCEAGLQACEDANKCGEAGWRLVGPSFGDTQAETDRSNGSEAGAQVSGQRCEQKMRSGSAGE